MKIKFSNKDLLLLFGILVAVIVALTTAVFSDQSSASPQTSKHTVVPKTSQLSPAFLLHKTLEKIEFKSWIR